jgi:hypothetical protein
MDPAVRVALTEDMTPTTADLQRELAQIETEIDTARQSLRQAEQKEIFLGQRSRQYRLAQDRKAQALKDEQIRLDALPDDEAGDEEVPDRAEWNRRMEQWERDEDALNGIIETHKQILAHCETMRWKLKELEAKRKACRSMISECTDFIEAAEGVRNDVEQNAREIQDHEQRRRQQQQQQHNDEDDEAQPSEFDPMIQIINGGIESSDDEEHIESQGFNNDEEAKV